MNIVVTRLSSFFQEGEDTFLINTYIPPSNSKRIYNTTDSNTNFEILHYIIRKYNDLGSVIVCGDLNARIGNCRDLITNDNSGDFLDLPPSLNNQVDIPFGCPVSSLRNSQDSGTNPHKQPLLDIINNNSMIILNGRTIGDSCGRYTCYKWNGNSVVDYFICNNPALSYIDSLSVKPHSLYSDHNPVVLNLRSVSRPLINTSSTNLNFAYAPVRYKIDDESLEAFRVNQSDPTFISQLNHLGAEASRCSTKEHVIALNDNITNLISSISSRCFDKTKPLSTSDVKPKHNAWFDKDCRTAKRLMNKSARVLTKHPDKQSIKSRHFSNTRSYRKLVKSKKDRFFSTLNRKIKNGKIISWRDFNNLKKFTKSEVKIDDSNLSSFHDFYQNLYSDDHRSMDHLTKMALLDNALEIVNSSSISSDILNSPFTREELDAAISGMKNGKASSFDMVSNEIIKAFSDDTRNLILNLFNGCLNTGCYLWGSSVVTPIHKKGVLTNPDNYRAIAVCSCIGKLLSTILLNRLINHRSSNSPDPPNQCGFTKGQQCNDHILTLITILEKYKRLKKKIFATFIDLRKAFDTVCRQALLFKLACYGVNGGFFHLIKDMYSNSVGYIKLNGKISPKFDILKGTEQGHPLSPELFKVYFRDLSILLNNAVTNNPVLSGTPISHLAWADDVVLLSLDRDSMDKQILILEKYCHDWGLEINTSKTKYMVLNSRRSSNDNQAGPRINGVELDRVDSYCYLGIKISSNGKFTNAVSSLAGKGLGALLSLRKTVDRRFIDPQSLDKLFNSLINPIITYGCQIWLPVSSIITSITGNLNDNNLLSQIAKQPYEKILLRHIKHLLGINRRSSNAAAWGETGRFPLIINCIKLCINYFTRTINLDDSHLVKAAMKEQINLSLPWFSGIKSIIETFDNIDHNDYNHYSSEYLNTLLLADLCSPTDIVNAIKDRFTSAWSTCIGQSPKLSFYSSVKADNFTWEPYLDSTKNFNERRTMAQIRCSSHKLSIEVGRYESLPRQDRICLFCSDNGIDTAVVEDENHLINICPIGTQIRADFIATIANICEDTSNFNLASTFPPNMVEVDDGSAPVRSRIIRLSCCYLHKLYSRMLQFKRDRLDSN